jgi:hypothetical protein
MRKNRCADARNRRTMAQLKPVLEGAAMKPIQRGLRRAAALLPLTLCLQSPAHAAGTVEVRWIEPARFSDVSRNPIERERELQQLGSDIARLGQQLPDGQALLLEVTDLNLAGEMQPLRWAEVRVLRGGADWPQMELRYTLQSGGRTLKSGQARLADMNYFFGLRRDQSGYEKRMVERWFKEEILGR